jgi:hypothetical protein
MAKKKTKVKTKAKAKVKTKAKTKTKKKTKIKVNINRVGYSKKSTSRVGSSNSTSRVKIKETSRVGSSKKKVQPFDFTQQTIPKGYGESKIVLMPRDSYWTFAYWEITEKTRKDIRAKYGKDIFEKSKLVLRVYYVTSIEFNGRNAHSYFDIAIDPFADNWYIKVPEPNKSLCIDLGIVLPDGRFITIVRSNTVIMPRLGVSPVTDEQWGVLQKEFERILKISGIGQVGKGSFDVVKLMRERWNQFMLLNLPSSPPGISSFRRMPVEEAGGAGAQAGEKGRKEFRLEANTEFILYGSTERDAKLTVGGEEVKLDPDGSFSLRFNLNDGVKELPVKATSADNTMSKSITFTVSRKTDR